MGYKHKILEVDITETEAYQSTYKGKTRKEHNLS